MNLLERDAVLEELGRWQAVAADGDGALVWLGGEAGIGKTSVARALATRTDSRVLWGSCDALSTPRPLGPLLDMARSGAGTVAALVAADASRHRVFEAFLEELATPTLAVIEDVHWADDATIDLLRFVGRRVGTTRSLVLVTYRSDEVASHPLLRTLLGDLATSVDCRRMDVAPLTLPGVAALAAGHSLDPERLHEVTGGNPFYVTEVLATSTWSVPATVADAVLARAGRLDPAARMAVDVTSIEPGGMELWLAQELGATTGGIRAAATAGMLVLDADTAHFRHELARRAIEDHLAADERRSLHAQALAALSPDRADPARLSHHAEVAGEADAVLRWAPDAAWAAVAAGAPREAVAQFERALRFVSGDDDPVFAVALLDELVVQLALVDRLDDALATSERALALGRSLGDPAADVVRRGAMARRLWSIGRGHDAYQAVAEATDDALRLPPEAPTSSVFADRAYMDMLARRGGAIDWAGEAIVRAEAHGDRRTLARALNARGSARICVADDLGGIEDLERARRIGEEDSVDSLVADALNNLGSALGEQRYHELAADYLERCIAFTRARDFDATRRYSEAWLARVRFEQGRWAEASALLTPELQRDGITPIAVMVALGVLGRLRVRRGDPGAVEPLERAWATAVGTGDLQRLWPAVAARVEAAWLTGTVTSELQDDLTSVLALAEASGVQYAIGELGFWAWKLDLRAAPLPPGAAPPYAAHVAGDFHDAARLWDELDAPYEAAWALADSGEEAALRDALDRFVALGATPMAQRVRHQLRQLGARDVPRGPRRSTAAGPAGLTAREQEVLAALAEGLTDREIAARLFMSSKTVGHHVSHILRKLDVRSRVEATAAYHSTSKDGEDSRFAT